MKKYPHTEFGYTVDKVPVRNPRIHHIGSKVYGYGRNGKRDYVIGTLVESYILKGALIQGYYVIRYPDGETRTYNVIHQAS